MPAAEFTGRRTGSGAVMEVDRITGIGVVGPQATPAWPRKPLRRRAFSEEVAEPESEREFAGEENDPGSDRAGQDPSIQEELDADDAELTAGEDGRGRALDLLA